MHGRPYRGEWSAIDHCPTCGVPWPASLADVEPLPCMGHHPHEGRPHWHRSTRTLGQLLEWQ